MKTFVPLLSLLASLPPEALREGTQLDIETRGGKAYTITIGPAIAESGPRAS